MTSGSTSEVRVVAPRGQAAAGAARRRYCVLSPMPTVPRRTAGTPVSGVPAAGAPRLRQSGSADIHWAQHEHPPLTRILAIAFGGALGALGRHGVSTAVAAAFGPRFPFGTLIVNVAGSFAMGWLFVLFAEKVHISPEMRLLLMTGLLGAFTHVFHLLGGDPGPPPGRALARGGRERAAERGALSLCGRPRHVAGPMTGTRLAP